MKLTSVEFETAAFLTLIMCLFSKIGETKIPGSVLYEMEEIHSLTELLLSLPISADNGIDISGNRHETSTGRARESEPVHVYARNHARNQASSSHPFPVDISPLPACEPRATIVETRSLLAASDDTIFWPHCLSVQRCGGCCNTDLFECVATETRNQTAEIIKLQYSSATSRLELAEMNSVHVQNDVHCACRCKVKPAHCRPDREIFNNCQCHCVMDLPCPNNFRWDPVTCNCVCDAPLSERRCRSKRETFNNTICGCLCDPSVRERCERKGLGFNSSKCKCFMVESICGYILLIQHCLLTFAHFMDPVKYFQCSSRSSRYELSDSS